jgi:tetratricopeptide (TPR) repeat protein
MSLSHLYRGLLVVTLLLTVAVSSAVAQARSGRMSGRVIDGAGEPLTNVAILAENPERPPIEGTTDGSGRFSIIGFTTGQWQVTATLEGYDPSVLSLRVSQQGVATANFSMSRILSGFELLLGEEALEGLDSAALEADLTAADAAFNAADYDTAITGYSGVLAALPALTNLHLSIGSAYRAKGDYEMALASFETVIEDPDRGEQAAMEIVRTKVAMGDLDAIAGLADAGANATREDLYNLGEVEFAKGEIETANGWYEKATMVDPNWELPWFKLALVALNKGDIEAAKQHFQKVILIAPDSDEGTQAQATISALP